MALINFTGFETGNNVEYVSAVGTVAVQSSVKRTGTYALQCNPLTVATGGVGLAGFQTNGLNASVFSVADCHVQFYFQYATIPAILSEQMAAIQVGGTAEFEVQIDSAGKLSLWENNGTVQIGSTGSTVLSPNTWYRIHFHKNSTTGAYSLAINGVTEFSGTASTTSNNDLATIGKFDNRNGQSVDFFFDDWRVDDATFTDQDYAATLIVPIANGSTMSWVNGTGSSDWQEVDTVPVDTATYIQSPTTGNPNVALFDLQSCATVGITGAIAALKGFIDTRENTSVTSATLIRIFSGATASDSLTRNGTTAFAWQMRLAEVDPNTSAAWTISGINAVEIGPVENNAVAVRCAAVYGSVLYTPSTTNIKSVAGVAYADIKSVAGVAKASIKSVAGLE